jgi:hypothetical protein
MNILVYDDLNVGRLGDKVEKVTKYLLDGDFPAADAKKMSNGFYRAKLDDTNRLLFCFGKYQEATYIFILEVIHNHAYEKSKFLNGAAIQEDKLLPLQSADEVTPEELKEVSYVNPHKKSFHLLDKILSFDDQQEEVLVLPTPSIIIGSAGSGKTALTLEKLKTLKGNILYITLSSYLAENAGHLYLSFGYDNKNQEVDFLSFYEYLSTIAMPDGREADFTSFERWIARYTQSHKIKDAYRVFEEIKGVITGSVIDRPFLSLEEYQALGIKQSIFSAAERAQVYDLFLKYKNWLTEEQYFDTNLVAYSLLDKVKPVYDYIVVDEVQDLTNVQLTVILKSLVNPSNFILCGDSNQIVHPNFFSWAQIKSLFYKQDLQASIVRVLATNYRNTPEVTAIANQLLLIKNARFGSIDKESTYLVVPNSNQKGEVEYLENSPKINADLNSKTSLSTKFAVLVLRNEDKAAARKFYTTPLLFSIQEAKGLEYENIILYNAISTYRAEFAELTNGVTAEDLNPDALLYARAKDKSDKSLEEYKFYVNSLYVGITRAVKNLYVVEADKKHALLSLLGLVDFKQGSSLTNQTSSKDEWQREARKLELQGKQEQADAIREQILQVKPVPWTITTQALFPELLEQGLNPDAYNRKAKDRLYYYALFYQMDKYLPKLAELKYKPAERYMALGYAEINLGLINTYIQDNLKLLMPYYLKHGVDFRNEVNFTPLMCAMMSNACKTLDYLLENGANIHLQENSGKNVFQREISCVYEDLNGSNFIMEKMFNPYYSRIRPESIKVRINKKLIKVSCNEGEFLILNIMLSVLYAQLNRGCKVFLPEDENYDRYQPGFQVSTFTTFYEGIAEHVLPENRRKPAYISSILSKNELNRKGSGNKKLFFRPSRGQYLPHPLMEIEVGKEWVNIYDSIDMENLAEMNKDSDRIGILAMIEEFRMQLEYDADAVLDTDLFWSEEAKKRVNLQD